MLLAGKHRFLVFGGSVAPCAPFSGSPPSISLPSPSGASVGVMAACGGECLSLRRKAGAAPKASDVKGTVEYRSAARVCRKSSFTAGEPSQALVDLASVSNIHGEYNEPIIFYLANKPVIPYSVPPLPAAVCCKPFSVLPGIGAAN